MASGRLSPVSGSGHVPSFNLPSFQLRNLDDPGITLPMISREVAESMDLQPASKEVGLVVHCLFVCLSHLCCS
jgi:hypothetical protein